MSGLKRVLLAVAPWLPVLIIGAPTAYAELFRRFAGFDDEGMYLSSLRFFTEGKPLYDEVFSQYGPVYHLAFGGFYKLTGFEIGAASGRMIVVVIWLITATMIGVAVRRITGNLLIGVCAQAVAFGSASLLSGEPMHPVGLVCLLLGAITLTLITVEQSPVKAGALLGLFLGLLMLIKINIGGVAAIAIVCAGALTLSPLCDRKWVRWAAIAIVLLLAPVLMAPDLSDDWVQKLILSIGATGGAALILLPAEARVQIPWRAFGFFVATLTGAAVAALALILALGSSPHQIIDNVVIQPTRLRLVFYAPLGQPNSTIYLAVASFAAAYVVRRSGVAGRMPQTPWPGAARIVVAVLMWGGILTNELFELGKGGRMLFPLALAWVALLPIGGWKDGKGAFTRLGLVLLATLEVLQVYPVAGTQIEVSALLFIPVSGLILADGIAALRAAPAVSFGRVDAARVRRLVPAGLIALLLVFSMSAIVLPLRTWGGAYRNNDPVSLPTTGGTHGLRLPADQAAIFRELVNGVQTQCKTLITMPGFTSLYLFLDRKPPDGFNSSDWIYLLDDREQGHTLEQIKDKPGLCLAVNYSTMAVWRLTTRLGDIPRLPMAKFIVDNRWAPIVVGGLNNSLVLYKRVGPDDPATPVLAPGY